MTADLEGPPQHPYRPARIPTGSDDLVPTGRQMIRRIHERGELP
jgi:hypothetical protein